MSAEVRSRICINLVCRHNQTSCPQKVPKEHGVSTLGAEPDWSMIRRVGRPACGLSVDI